MKYNNRGEFSRKNSTAYKASHKNKWIDEICNHMVIINKPNDYWTKEKCHEEALKYETKSEFSKNSPSAYVKSGASGWKDDICQHMKTNGNKYKRCIYSVEFSDNSVYIGLTYNFDKRCEQHLKDINSTVYKHYIHIGVKPKMLKLTDYLPVDNASKQESIEMNYYLSNGWNILNKAKCGNVGGKSIKWTKEKCKEEALKFNHRIDFKRGSMAYKSASNNKWLDDICEHMTELIKKPGYWTKEICLEESKKYMKIDYFKKYSSGAFNASYKNGWLDEFYPKNIVNRK